MKWWKLLLKIYYFFILNLMIEMLIFYCCFDEFPETYPIFRWNAVSLLCTMSRTTVLRTEWRVSFSLKRWNISTSWVNYSNYLGLITLIKLFDEKNPVNMHQERLLFSTEGHIFPIDRRFRDVGVCKNFTKSYLKFTVPFSAGLSFQDAEKAGGQKANRQSEPTRDNSWKEWRQGF